MSDDCVFCKIVDLQIPSTKVYEDEKVLAFLDIAPGNHGHTLVVPKGHYPGLKDIPEDILNHLMLVVQKLAPAVVEAVGAPAYNVEQANGTEAGQVVPHAHFHIIPRFAEDEVQMTWNPGSYEEGEAEKVAEKIKTALEAPQTSPSPDLSAQGP